MKYNVLLEALKLARGTSELRNRALIFATLVRKSVGFIATQAYAI
jgi:hypothetical protein